MVFIKGNEIFFFVGEGEGEGENEHKLYVMNNFLSVLDVYKYLLVTPNTLRQMFVTRDIFLYVMIMCWLLWEVFHNS